MQLLRALLVGSLDTNIIKLAYVVCYRIKSLICAKFYENNLSDVNKDWTCKDKEKDKVWYGIVEFNVPLNTV